MRFPLTTDLAIQLERRIDAICSERPIRDEHAHTIASKHRALPLFRGMDGYCALALTGQVLEFEWPRFDDPMPISPRRRAYGAIAIGARHYPELAPLLPTRQPEDADCEHCGGSGRHPLAIETSDERVLCECGGLGFLPSYFPDGEPAPAPHTSSVFPDILPSKYQSGYIYQIVSDQDVKDVDGLGRLINAMFDDPEHEFVYYRPKDRPSNALIADAVARGVIAEGELEFFHYLREPGGRNFVHLERGEFDDTRAEYLWGYDKRDVLWRQQVTAGEMYIKTSLTLTERTRRSIESDHVKDRNPIELKPGAFGLNLDLLKTWSLARDWFRRWKIRRRRS